MQVVAADLVAVLASPPDSGPAIGDGENHRRGGRVQAAAVRHGDARVAAKTWSRVRVRSLRLLVIQQPGFVDDGQGSSVACRNGVVDDIDRNPFDGVVFDEAFVAAATRSERSAAQRHAESAWRRRDEHDDAAPARRTGRRRRWARFGVVVAIAGAVGAGVFTFVAGPTSGDVGVYEGFSTTQRPALSATSGERLSPSVEPPATGGLSVFLELRSDGLPVGFDPCRPVRVVVNVDGAPEGAIELVDEVTGVLASVTGLVFVVDGVTDEEPRAERLSYDPDRYGQRWSPVLVAWTDETAVPDLEGDAIGVGGPSFVGLEDQELYAVSGAVFVDVDRGGDTVTGTDRAILLHEFGHALGLDHVDDPTQIMNPEATVDDLGVGDLGGFATLGAIPCAGRL